MQPDNASPGPWQLVVDWFWLSHDDTSGKPLLSPAHVALGAGSALLAELVLAEYVALQDELIVPTTRQPPPDVLAHQVFSVMLAEPAPLPVRTWLSYLSRTARTDLGHHLERRGLARTQRTLLRRAPRWVPTDLNVAGLPGLRIRSLLINGEKRSAHDPVLAGLAEVTELLGSVLDPDEIRTARESMPAVTEVLPPAIRMLLGQTRARVSATVLSERS